MPCPDVTLRGVDGEFMTTFSQEETRLPDHVLPALTQSFADSNGSGDIAHG